MEVMLLFKCLLAVITLTTGFVIKNSTTRENIGSVTILEKSNTRNGEIENRSNDLETKMIRNIKQQLCRHNPKSTLCYQFTVANSSLNENKSTMNPSSVPTTDQIPVSVSTTVVSNNLLDPTASSTMPKESSVDQTNSDSISMSASTTTIASTNSPNPTTTITSPKSTEETDSDNNSVSVSSTATSHQVPLHQSTTTSSIYTVDMTYDIFEYYDGGLNKMCLNNPFIAYFELQEYCDSLA